jgi:FKBP12-rapamycin complex-associated protein
VCGAPARRTLGALAEKCHAFAKALHYKELEYHQTPGAAVEALISINNHLRQPEAAIGILTKAQQDLHMELKARRGRIRFRVG